jgi:hypothetical protein
MTVQKTGPLVLLMFTVLCALPVAAAVGVIPSAMAQEEDDDTNTQIGVPISDQDQGAANLGANLGANLAANVDTEEIIEEARSTTPTPSEEEEAPEFEAFCFVPAQFPNSLQCYPTMEDCNLSESSFFGPAIEGEGCKGFETRPPDAQRCEIIRDQVTGVPTGAFCLPPPP